MAYGRGLLHLERWMTVDDRTAPHGRVSADPNLGCDVALRRGKEECIACKGCLNQS